MVTTQQGTKEWHLCRSFSFTSSTMGEVMTVLDRHNVDWPEFKVVRQFYSKVAYNQQQRRNNVSQSSASVLPESSQTSTTTNNVSHSPETSNTNSDSQPTMSSSQPIQPSQSSNSTSTTSMTTSPLPDSSNIQTLLTSSPQLSPLITRRLWFAEDCAVHAPDEEVGTTSSDGLDVGNGGSGVDEENNDADGGDIGANNNVEAGSNGESFGNNDEGTITDGNENQTESIDPGKLSTTIITLEQKMAL